MESGGEGLGRPGGIKPSPGSSGRSRPDPYCRLTISLIQIGANGEVQPFDTG
jgi:hypothetical protein